MGGIKLAHSQDVKILGCDHYLATSFEFPPGYRELLLTSQYSLPFLHSCLTNEMVNLVDTETPHNITQYIFIHQSKTRKDYFECKNLESGLVH